MMVPGSVPNPVVVLFGLKRIVAPELLVDMLPEIAPAGSVPLAPGGVEFTLMVRSRPVRFTFVPVPVEKRFPKLTMLGVATFDPEPAL